MMKKTLVFALSLMLVAVFAVGCSMGKDESVTVSPTLAATVETDNGNVTDDAASDNIMDDMEETIEGTPTAEPAAEATEETNN